MKSLMGGREGGREDGRKQGKKENVNAQVCFPELIQNWKILKSNSKLTPNKENSSLLKLKHPHIFFCNLKTLGSVSHIPLSGLQSNFTGSFI